MDIRCRKTDCKFNEGLTCCIKALNIDNKNTCVCFERGKERIDISRQIFSDTPPDIKDYRHLKDINMHCKTECLFNKKGKCIANGITINEVKDIAKCITFMEK